MSAAKINIVRKTGGNATPHNKTQPKSALHDTKRNRNCPHAGRRANRGKLSLLGSTRGAKNSRVGLGRNGQVTGEFRENRNFPYQVELTTQCSVWRGGIGANSGLSATHGSGYGVFANNSRSAVCVSGRAGTKLGKYGHSAGAVARPNREATGQCLGPLYYAATPICHKQRTAQERPAYRYMRKICTAGMGYFANNASHIFSAWASYRFSFLRNADKSLAIEPVCSSSLGISPIGLIPPFAPFWPVRYSKIDSLGTKEGFAASLAGGFLSSLISFLIESVVSPMMEVAGAFGNMRPCQTNGSIA